MKTRMCLLFPHNFLFPQWAALSQKGRKPKSLIKRIIPVTKRHLLLSEKPITHASDVMQGLGRCAVYLFAKYTLPSRSDEQKNEENEWTIFALRITGRWFGVLRALSCCVVQFGSLNGHKWWWEDGGDTEELTIIFIFQSSVGYFLD